jgi:hypothetical protein
VNITLSSLEELTRSLQARETARGEGRAEPRDYMDVAACLDHYTIDGLIGLARRLDTGLDSRDIADVGQRLDGLPDGTFTRYGLDPGDVAGLRQKFADWPRP